MRSKKLSVAIDFDDTLCAYIPHVIDILNENHPEWNLNVTDIKDWALTSFTEEQRRAFMDVVKSPKAFERQTPLPGAVEMLQTLVDWGHDVFIFSAASPEFMSFRAKQVLAMFPMIEEKNIVVGGRKDIINTDILFDDAIHNIAATKAKYPILFRKPWNVDLSGVLSVNNYADFLNLVRQISESVYVPARSNGPRIICLIGPSGSGKTSIAQTLIEDPRFAIPRSATTRARRPGESETAYRFVTPEEFYAMEASGELLESTVYAGHRYGMQRKEIDNILDSGRHVVVAIDICGATTIKTVFGERADMVFIWRGKNEIISEILARNTSDDEKVRRIMSIDSEYGNEHLCDYTVKNTGSLKESAAQIIEHI